MKKSNNMKIYVFILNYTAMKMSIYTGFCVCVCVCVCIFVCRVRLRCVGFVRANLFSFVKTSTVVLLLRND